MANVWKREEHIHYSESDSESDSESNQPMERENKSRSIQLSNGSVAAEKKNKQVEKRNRPYDLVIWGATSYTAKLALGHLVRTYGPPKGTLRFAIAGRCMHGLEAVLKGQNVQHGVTIDKIIAKIEFPDTINEMCKKSRCIISFAGPYTEIGEVVLKACVENGTHYVDISGEVEWISKMYNQYNDTAVKNDSKMLMSYGFDCLACILPIHQLKKEFASVDQELHEINQFFELPRGGFSVGTIRTMLKILRTKSWREVFFNEIDQYKVCKRSEDLVQNRQETSIIPYYSRGLNKWISNFVMAPIMSQYFRWINEKWNHEMGVNVILRIKEMSDSFCESFIRSEINYIFTAVSYIVTQFFDLSKWLPKSGFFSMSPESRAGKEMKVVTVGTGIDKNTSTYVSKALEMKTSMEPYEFSGVVSVEAGIVCLEVDHDQVSKKTTEERLFERLKSVGIRFNFVPSYNM